MVLSRIPPTAALDTRGVRLQEKNEPLVDAVSYTGGKILADMQYIRAGRPGAIAVPLVRQSVADMLLRAAALLPDGVFLKIYDAWRPYSVQKSIYDEYFAAVAADEANSGQDEEALHLLTTKFVSRPILGKRLSYVHSSGGAVDLTLADREGRELPMGTAFDAFTPLAATAALEGKDCPAAANRRLLYTVMTAVGFTNYPEEWWHYDYGDLFWAATTGKDALYASIYDVKGDFCHA